MRKSGRTILGVMIASVLASSAQAAEERKVPYWASIAAGQAMMRSGPDRTYPGTWLYRRRDLPVRVVQVYGAWRRVTDQDGTTGWMLAILLAARRSAVVVNGYQPVMSDPSEGSRLLWQVQEGVVGRIQECDGSWCHIDVGGHVGWIRETGIWGTDPAERVK